MFSFHRYDALFMLDTGSCCLLGGFHGLLHLQPAGGERGCVGRLHLLDLFCCCLHLPDEAELVFLICTQCVFVDIFKFYLWCL